MTDLFRFQILYKEKKSVASDWIGHVTCMTHGLKDMDQPDHMTSEIAITVSKVI